MVKGLRTGSPALQRTLHVYGVIRARGAEDWAPLPLLYKVEPRGDETLLWMEYLGGDVAKTRVPASVFDPSPRNGDPAPKKWVVAPSRSGGVLQAWCVDVGGSLARAAPCPRSDARNT